MKMTKKEVLNYLKETYKEDATVQEYVAHEIELLENKAKSNERRKAQKKADQAEMEEKIYKVLSEVSVATAKEIADEIGVKFQQVTPRLTAMVNDGRANRRVEGKNVFFSKAE